jgi:hypothetical protein
MVSAWERVTPPGTWRALTADDAKERVSPTVRWARWQSISAL